MLNDGQGRHSRQQISPRISWWWITGILALMIAANCWFWRTASYASVRLEDSVEQALGSFFLYHEYAALLAEFVDTKGLVDYRGLKQNRSSLDNFSLSLERVDSESYEGWKEKDQIALWINAYNALTLKAIVDHYPIESSFLASLRFPKNSIRQISGVWDKLLFSVRNEKVTLDQIEHRILRPRFKEPRIHVALVCAAMGCPPLRDEPFIGNRLDAQLDDQSRRFLTDPKKFLIDRDRARVFLSPILKWYGKDFLPTYATKKGFSGHDSVKRATLNFLARYLDPDDRAYLETGDYEVKYLDYDWSLNERPAGR